MTKLTGRVSIEGGELAPNTTVEVVNSAGDVVDQVSVADDGSFLFHLSAGRWSLRGWDSQGRRAAAEVEIHEGADASTALRLEEGG